MKFGVWKKKKLGWTISDLMQVGWTIFGPNELQPSKEPLKLLFFPACKNSHYFRIGWFTPGVDHFSNFRIVRDPNHFFDILKKFKFIKNIKYEIWSLEKKLEV
jgi:hypothetical protein